jgi:hypothetical protein
MAVQRADEFDAGTPTQALIVCAKYEIRKALVRPINTLLEPPVGRCLY